MAEVVAVQLKMAVGRAASPAASAPSPTSTSYVDTATVPTVTLETNKMGEPTFCVLSYSLVKLAQDHELWEAGYVFPHLQDLACGSRRQTA